LCRLSQQFPTGGRSLIQIVHPTLATCRGFLRYQRLNMGALFDLLSFVIATNMCGHNARPVKNAHPLRIGHHG
jgi:hypothetical protein